MLQHLCATPLPLQTPTGSQFQAGSVTPQATRAQSAATGQSELGELRLLLAHKGLGLGLM